MRQICDLIKKIKSSLLIGVELSNVEPKECFEKPSYSEMAMSEMVCRRCKLCKKSRRELLLLGGLLGSLGNLASLTSGLLH